MLTFRIYIAGKPSAIAAVGQLKNVVFLLDVETADCSNCYSLLSQQLITGDFCLLLSVERILNKEHANDVLPFFFFPNYYKDANRLQVFWKSIPPHLIDQAKEELEKALLQQGFDSPQQHLLIPSPSYMDFAEMGLDQIASAYNHSLHHNTHPFCIRVDETADLLALINTLAEVEIRFQKEQPVIFQLKAEHQHTKQELNRATSLLHAVKQELTTCQLHMDILRSGTEARQLQDFYTNEYEILPLWYKKIGHVIKVLTGKRSLRSLFSDKVKKYKT